MALPAAAGFVHGADKADLASVGEFDDARLAMQKAADTVGGHSHRLPMLVQKSIEPAIPVAVQERFCFQTTLVPAADHLRFPQLGHLEVIRMDIHVADDLHVGD
jgi:hypothetical protein